MKRETKSYVVILVLFGIAAIVSWNLYLKEYVQRDTIDIHLFPKEIGSWQSKDLPLTETEYAILETRNVFMREYTNTDGRQVYLFVVYSQTNRKISHPPEVCYIGSGVSVTDKSLTSVPVESENLLIDVNQLLLEKGLAKHLAFYWFKVGNSFTSSYWKQQILIALKTLFGRPSSSALIRVSVDIKDNDHEAAVQQLTEFTRLITPRLLPYLP